MEIAPPLLGKFQALILDTLDLEGLARCLPPPPSTLPGGLVDRRLQTSADDVGRISSASERNSPRGNGLSVLALTGVVGESEAGGLDIMGSPTTLSIFSSDSNTTYAEEEVCVLDGQGVPTNCAFVSRFPFFFFVFCASAVAYVCHVCACRNA